MTLESTNEPAPGADGRRLVWGMYAASAALLLIAWGPIVLGRLQADYYNSSDLGIYAQAIHRVSWSDPNPYLTVQGVKIFNEHFDPILLVAAPLARVIEPALAGILVEFAFVLASPWAVVWLWRRGQIAAEPAAIAIAYLLHNRGTINGLIYPIHPTTWAILPAAWLGAGMLADRRPLVLASLLALLCCKEEFPLVGVMAAIVYLWRRQFSFAALLAALSVGWLLGAVYLRPWALGSVVDFASERLWKAKDFGAQLAVAWHEFRFRFLTQILVPLAPSAAWAVWRRQRLSLWLWLLLLPPLAVRFVGYAWKFHYLAVLGPMLVLGLTPSRVDARMPRWVVAGACALLLAINAAFWWGSVKYDPDNSRPWRADRMASIARGREFLLAHPDGRALLEGNLAPRLVTRREIFVFRKLHDRLAREFRYVFLEKPPFGDPWPMTADDCQRLMDQWRATPGTRAILDDEHVFLAEGVVPDSRP